MSRQRFSAEEIVNELREADVLIEQGRHDRQPTKLCCVAVLYVPLISYTTMSWVQCPKSFGATLDVNAAGRSAPALVCVICDGADRTAAFGSWLAL